MNSGKGDDCLLCCALVRPHLSTVSRHGTPGTRKAQSSWCGSGEVATKLLRGLEYLTFKEVLVLEEGTLQGDLSVAFQY